MVKSAMVTKKGMSAGWFFMFLNALYLWLPTLVDGITDVRNKVIVPLSSTAAFGKGAKASRYHGHPSARHDA